MFILNDLLTGYVRFDRSGSPGFRKRILVGNVGSGRLLLRIGRPDRGSVFGHVSQNGRTDGVGGTQTETGQGQGKKPAPPRHI